MKKPIFILLLMVGLGTTTYAQHEYRLAKASGTLKITLNNVIIEGYEGKDIIFTGEKSAVEETDERAKGLMMINSSGYSDNTGLGISVSENTQEVVVKSASKKPLGLIKIKVPQGLKISMLENNSRFIISTATKSDPGEIVLRNLKNEIEISVYHSKIKLENNTGPMNIKTVSGPIEASFDGEIKGPISLTSVTDYVDVTLPNSTKANLEMATGAGKIYAAREFNIDFEKQPITSMSYTLSSVAPLQVRTSASANTTHGNLSNKDIKITTKAHGNNQVKEIVIDGQKDGTTSTKNTKAKDFIIVADDVKAVTVDGVKVDTHGTGIVQSDVVSAINYDHASSIYFGGGEKIKGKLNGGGIDVIIKSNNKNVYLRQK